METMFEVTVHESGERFFFRDYQVAKDLFNQASYDFARELRNSRELRKTNQKPNLKYSKSNDVEYWYDMGMEVVDVATLTPCELR